MQLRWPKYGWSNPSVFTVQHSEHLWGIGASTFLTATLKCICSDFTEVLGVVSVLWYWCSVRWTGQLPLRSPISLPYHCLFSLYATKVTTLLLKQPLFLKRLSGTNLSLENNLPTFGLNAVPPTQETADMGSHDVRQEEKGPLVVIPCMWLGWVSTSGVSAESPISE